MKKFRLCVPYKKTINALTAFVFIAHILFNFISATPVLADNFYASGGDGDNCEVAGAVGVQYNNIGGNGVQWNSADVVGQSGNWLQSHSFNDIGTIQYPNAHRYPGVGDFVAVPPHTTVEFGVWVMNYSGHSVRIDSMDFWTARSNPANGDMTRLGSGGQNGNICFTDSGSTGSNCRGSKYVHVPWGNSYSNWNVGQGGQVFYSFETIQPINQVSFAGTPVWTGNSLQIRYDLVLQNISSYNLCNINVTDTLPTGEVYNQNHCINAGQTSTITYYANFGTSYPKVITNDPARISDNNSHTEVPTAPITSAYQRDGETRPMIFRRSDSGAPSNWNAYQPAWGETGNFGVRLIPYWFNSASITNDVNSVISVTKTVSDSDETNVTHNTANNREQITYKVTVTNTGGIEDDINVIDDYDQNFINIVSSDGGTDNGDTLTWNIPSLDHGQSRTFTIVANIKDLNQGNYTFRNGARTTGPDVGPVWVDTTVNTSATLTLDKRVTDSNENNVKVNSVQGDHYLDSERNLTFTLNYSNTGSATAHNVILTDNLSEFANSGLLVEVKNISNGGTYNPNNHVITWDIGTLQYGQSGSRTFEISISRATSPDKSLVNNSSIDSEETQPTTSTTTTNILTPIIEISKTDNRTTVNTGENLNYVITVRNSGTGNAYNLTIDDLLPAYVTNVTNISDNGVYDSNSRIITWTNSTDPEGISLNSGSSKTYTFQVSVPSIMPLGTTTLNNRASVVNPVITKVWGQDNTDVTALPNYQLVKYVKNITAIESNREFNGNNVDGSYGANADTWLNNEKDVRAIAGDILEFTIVYRNTGNTNAPETFVADHLPRYIVDSNGNQFEIIRSEDFVSVENGITPVANGNNWDIVWSVGQLDVNQEYSTKTFRVRINPNSQTTYSTTDLNRVINNIGSIYSNNALITTHVENNAMLRVEQPIAQITKGSDKTVYQSNEKVVYTIEVRNTGTAKAVGIVTDTLPTGVHYISSSPEANVNGKELTWNISLEIGEIKTITITVGFDTPVIDGNYFNNNVTYSYRNENNNQRPDVNAHVDVRILAPIIEVTKEKVDPKLVTPLNTIKYTVRIRNVGNGNAFNVQVSDNIDPQLLEVLTSTISDGGTYDSQKHTITWSIGNLNSQQVVTRTFEARILFGGKVQNGTQIYNQAIVTNDTSDTVSSNVVSSTISCGYLSGTVWEDRNKNALIEEGEYRIPNANINVSVSDFEKYGAKFVSDNSGNYVATCLPFEKEVNASIERPRGYIGQTTVDNYIVNLSDTGNTTIYRLDEKGDKLFVWAGKSFEHADLGLYRTRLSSGSVLGVSTMAMSYTGQPLLVGFGLATMGLIGVYLCIVERKNIYQRLQLISKTYIK